MIQLLKPKIYDNSIENVKRVLKSGWIGLGPVVKEFEEKFAEYVNTPYSVAFNSATEALRAAVLLSGIKPGEAVITTPNTFVSTNHVLLQSRLRPMFADVDPFTGNISMPSIEHILAHPNLGYQVSLIMVVHYAGQPVDMEELYNIAGRYHVKVVEDCAHAVGSKYDGKMIGCGDSEFCCFSFHAVKQLGIGDGGMLTTSRKDVYEEAKRLRWLGIDKSTSDRTKEDGYQSEYNCTQIGYKSHMNDISAAIALGQLERLDVGIALRRGLMAKYREGLPREVPLLQEKPNRFISPHLAVVFAGRFREKIVSVLKTEDIQTGYHYVPNYNYPMYSQYYRDNNCKGMEAFYRGCLTLPLHLDMNLPDVEKICFFIREAVKEHAN